MNADVVDAPAADSPPAPPLSTWWYTGAAIVLCLVLATVTRAAGAGVPWPEDGAVQSSDQLAVDRERFETLLAQSHGELVARVSSGAGQVSERVRTALDSQHAAWPAYRDAECEVVGALGSAGATWQQTQAAQCQASLTEKRYRTVRRALRCVEALPSDAAGLMTSRCLTRLTLLALVR